MDTYTKGAFSANPYRQDRPGRSDTQILHSRGEELDQGLFRQANANWEVANVKTSSLLGDLRNSVLKQQHQPLSHERGKGVLGEGFSLTAVDDCCARMAWMEAGEGMVTPAGVTTTPVDSAAAVGLALGG